jgi:hypothetical protein
VAKRMTKADRATLHALVATYGKHAVIKAIEKAPAKEPGRPAHYNWNVPQVWVHVEHRRGKGAKTIEVACQQIARDLRKYVAGKTQSTGTLRGLYYDAVALRKKDIPAANRMDAELANLRAVPNGAITFPLLLRQMADALESPIIDVSDFVKK